MNRFETNLVKVAILFIFVSWMSAQAAPGAVEKATKPITQAFSSVTKAITTKKAAAEQPFRLDIDKINVHVPIIANVDDTNEEAYLKAIENGVALSKNHAGSPAYSGNMFIYGHSSYYKNKPGNYKEVFSQLNKLSPNDQFNIQYQGKSYTYKVLDSKEVSSKDFSILIPKISPNIKMVTLMTCWPVGTSDKRWVVTAQQI